MSTNPTCLIVTPKIRELAAKFPNETVESVKNLVSLWQAKNNKSSEDIPMGYELQDFIKKIRKKANRDDGLPSSRPASNDDDMLSRA